MRANVVTEYVSSGKLGTLIVRSGQEACDFVDIPYFIVIGVAF